MNGNQTLDFGFVEATGRVNLGNLVWRDLNGDGHRDAGEPAIPGVYLQLLADSNGNGYYDGSDPEVGAAWTDADGKYQFRGLPPGDYFVRVTVHNFWPGGVLEGLVSSPGVAPANNDMDDDDNGTDVADPATSGVASAPISLSAGGEPDAAVDGDDTDGNQTVDFGFTAEAPPNSAPVVLCPAPTTVECGQPVTVSVNVSDADNDELTVTLQEGSLALGTQTVSAGGTAGGAVVAFTGLSLSLGSHELTVSVSDGNHPAAVCMATVTVVDRTPPTITCPANITVPCSVDLLVPVTFALTATDNCEATPVVTCSLPPGSAFPVGTTTVTCTARDASGNESSCTFTVTRASLEFAGFLPPIGGADATGGSFASPLRAFKLKSTIPIKFQASCGNTPVLAGIHTLQAIKWS